MSQTTQEERLAWMQSDGDHLNRRAVYRLLQDFSELEAENKTLREQNMELERKGKDLCQAYGNALIKIHDLEAQVAAYEKPFTLGEVEAQYGDDLDTDKLHEYAGIATVLLASRKLGG